MTEPSKYYETIERIDAVLPMLTTDILDHAATVSRIRFVQGLAARAEVELIKMLRDSGESWAAIGALYGVSKQAAQQRFGA